jgi:hypothetical protein
MEIPYDNPGFPDILSHELGHLAGYVGDVPPRYIHSSILDNLMYGASYQDGTPGHEFYPKIADRQWCQKVAALAH